MIHLLSHARAAQVPPEPSRPSLAFQRSGLRSLLHCLHNPRTAIRQRRRYLLERQIERRFGVSVGQRLTGCEGEYIRKLVEVAEVVETVETVDMAVMVEVV